MICHSINQKIQLQFELTDVPIICGEGSKPTLNANEPRPYNVDQLAERCLKIIPSILMQTRVTCETPRASQPRRSNGDHLVLTRNFYLKFPSIKSTHSSGTIIGKIGSLELGDKHCPDSARGYFDPNRPFQDVGFKIVRRLRRAAAW